jgi:tetratricopeptide (TPR) repeat protein
MVSPMSADPSPLDKVIEDAIGRHKAGQLPEAEALYRQVLAEDPAHPEANHNLGIILTQRGQNKAGLFHFKTAVQNDPKTPIFWLGYARALTLNGQGREAIDVLAQGHQYGLTGPGYEALMAQAKASSQAKESEAADRMHFNLGNTLTEQGRYQDAIDAFRRALAVNPEFADAHYHLGSVLSETGKVAEGFAHLMRHAELKYGAGKSPAKSDPDPLHRTKHDREQREYLSAGEGDIFRIGDGARIAGGAVNPANATPALFAKWRAAAPQYVVLEDFLTPGALSKLRVYCAESTIWRRNYEAGYIGATPPDGFACPLLAQIVEEIQTLYADIFRPHAFYYLGAFKYDSELSTGTNTHADFSAVNVNFYIAPDDANLDPDSGGMMIWNREATDEAEMRRYNSDEPATRTFLAESGAEIARIPHRANRAVIFKSSLYHKTDDCRFKEGYLNKRINVSLLFGQFGASTR